MFGLDEGMPLDCDQICNNPKKRSINYSLKTKIIRKLGNSTCARNIKPTQPAKGRLGEIYFLK